MRSPIVTDTSHIIPALPVIATIDQTRPGLVTESPVDPKGMGLSKWAGLENGGPKDPGGRSDAKWIFEAEMAKQLLKMLIY